MKTAILILLLSAPVWAGGYTPNWQSETEAISEVNALKQFCKGLQMWQGKHDPDHVVTQAQVDYTCKERIPIAEKALADKAWLKRP